VKHANNTTNKQKPQATNYRL